MCVEASFQERPIVSVCINSNVGWPGKYWVPMSEIGVWPTHSRFRTSGAGQVALNIDELRQALNFYLRQPRPAWMTNVVSWLKNVLTRMAAPAVALLNSSSPCWRKSMAAKIAQRLKSAGQSLIHRRNHPRPPSEISHPFHRKKSPKQKPSSRQINISYTGMPAPAQPC